MASAAPATFQLHIATKIKSPIIFTIQAIVTKINGLLESPNPRKIALITLYATMKNIHAPHICT